MGAKGLDYVINLLDGNSSGVEKAKSKIGEVDHAVAGVETRSNSLAKGLGMLGILVGSVFATEKIIDFGKEALESAKTIRMASAQVAQGIQTTGGVAGKTLEELKTRAEDLEKTTLFGDEQTMGAESLLLTFTKIRGKIFDDAIPAIQDLATRMGGEGPADLKGASIQVGKALNDPIRGITALQRVGVSFTKVQKDQIENLVKHNHLAQAQKLILAELNTEFGGSAVAARQAAGPQADLKVAYENLLKAIGPLLQNGITPLVTWLAEGVTWLTKMVGKYDDVVNTIKNGYQWVKSNADIFKDLAIGIGLSTAAFLIANPTVIAYGVSLAADAVISGALAVATGVMTAAQWALNAAMTANPIGVLIVGIGALIGGLVYAYQHAEKFRAILDGIGNVAKTVFEIIKETIGRFVGGIGKIFSGDFKGGFKDLGTAIIDSNPIGLALHQGKRLANAFNKGYDDSIKESKEKKAKEAAAPVGKKGSEHATIEGKGRKPAALTSGLGSGSSSGSTESTAAGRSVKNISIVFQSMIKEFTQNVTNLKGQDGIQLKRMITDLLATAAADAEILVGE
jgi:hypothetical protein